MECNLRELSYGRGAKVDSGAGRSGKDRSAPGASEGVTERAGGAIGVALGLAVERSRSLAQGAAWATAALAGYYALRNVGSVLTAEGLLSPAASPVLLLVTLASFAALTLRKAPR